MLLEGRTLILLALFVYQKITIYLTIWKVFGFAIQVSAHIVNAKSPSNLPKSIAQMPVPSNDSLVKWPN
jgi:hypothetical protein